MRALVQQFTDEAEPRPVEISDEQRDHILGKDIGFTKLTDVDSVESLLEMMRQEKLFTHQEKLLQVILRTEQGLILRRYIWTLLFFGQFIMYGHVFFLCILLTSMFRVSSMFQQVLGKLAPFINAFGQVFMLQVQLHSINILYYSS